MPKKKTAKNKPSKKASAQNAKKSLGSLSQTHGKEEKFQPTTLDQIWGETGNTRYGTTDVNEYIRKLEEMNTTDLQTHAHIMGFVPLDDRVTLIKKLISEFKKHCSSFTKPTSLPSNNPMVSGEISQDVKRTLSEGR